jgi:hypothetical protein
MTENSNAVCYRGGIGTFVVRGDPHVISGESLLHPRW